jgi:single-strand DNA-binding protein
MSANRVILVGNLGKDPELKHLAQGLAVCTLSVATSERRKDLEGVFTEHTQWHRVVCFGRVAECSARYLTKGRQVYVEGRIETDRWTDKEGKERYTTSIIAQQVQFLGARTTAEKESQESNFAPEAQADEQPSYNLGLVSADSLASQ